MKTYGILSMVVVVFSLLVVATAYAARGPCKVYTGYIIDSIACNWFTCEDVKVVYFDMGECEDKDENPCPLTAKTAWVVYAPAQTSCVFSCSAASTGTGGEPQLLCN
jgi:hypothetical protein